jgi:hypothetical protein
MRLGWACKDPNKRLELASGSTYYEGLLGDRSTCAATSPDQTGIVVLLHLFWSTATGVQRSTRSDRIIQLSGIVEQCRNQYD